MEANSQKIIVDRAISEEQSQYLVDFETIALDPTTFDHRAHVYVTWLYLKRWQAGDIELDDVLAKVGAGLLAFASNYGLDTKYSQTITEAFVILITDAFILQPEMDFDHFMGHWPGFQGNFIVLLKRYYSQELLFSERARREFVQPDLNALPCTVLTGRP